MLKIILDGNAIKRRIRVITGLGIREIIRQVCDELGVTIINGVASLALRSTYGEYDDYKATSFEQNHIYTKHHL